MAKVPLWDGPHDDETVEQALERRGNIRVGLNGLRTLHIPSGEQFICQGSIWNKDSRLELYVDPDFEEEIVDKERRRLADLGIYDLREEDMRDLRKVHSWDCRLLDPWPILPNFPCRIKPYFGKMPYRGKRTIHVVKCPRESKHPIRTFADVARNVEKKRISDKFHKGDVVYFFHNKRASAVKIGFTNNLNKRFRSLSGANCDELICIAWIPGGREIEAEIHQEFQQHRIRGEWFHCNEVVEKAILDIRELGWPLD